MSPSRRLRRTRGLLTYLVVVGAGVLLWPTSLGGCMTTVVVTGTSMEPTYHPGDAVLAWCGAPHEGDVVVYRPPGVANLQVIHRVVGGDASGWLTEGDNNRGPDPFTPTNDDVVGIARIHVPNVGTALHQLTSPAVWGGLIVVGVAILVWPGRRLEAPTPPGPA